MSLIIPANSASAAGGYAVDNSLRFNSGSSDYLNKTFGSAGNQKTWTWSAWIKRSKLGTDQVIFTNRTDGNNRHYLSFNTSNQFNTYGVVGGTDIIQANTTSVFRDVSAWYNVVVAFDTTEGTGSNRYKVYVNGVQQSINFTTTPSVNANGSINDNGPHFIGNNGNNGSYFDGYLTEVCFINDTALAPTSFGEFDEDSGIWKPIDVSGLTFGTNGFYLDFENSGALGADVSGNTNNFTVNNLTAIDQSTNTCTNNGATLNSLVAMSTGAFSEGNLKNASSSSGNFGAVSTIGVSSSKWYAEFKPVSATGDKKRFIGVIGNIGASSSSMSACYAYGLQSFGDSGSLAIQTYANGSSVDVTSSYTGYKENDIVGIALDLENNKIFFSINGTYEDSSNPATNSGGLSLGTAPPDGVFYFAIGDFRSVDVITYECNFGSPPYSESGGETDGNGYGNFAHAVPTNYYSLNTKNLAEYG